MSGSHTRADRVQKHRPSTSVKPHDCRMRRRSWPGGTSVSMSRTTRRETWPWAHSQRPGLFRVLQPQPGGNRTWASDALAIRQASSALAWSRAFPGRAERYRRVSRRPPEPRPAAGRTRTGEVHEEILKTSTGPVRTAECIGMPNWSLLRRDLRVLRRVTQIIDEKTGKMLEMKNAMHHPGFGVCEARYSEMSDVLSQEHLSVLAGNMAGASGTAGDPPRSGRSVAPALVRGE